MPATRTTLTCCLAPMVMAHWAGRPTQAEASCHSASSAPQVIFTDGNIYTLDATKPRAEALAVRDGRIAAVGSNQDIALSKGPDTVVVSLGRRTVLPGLIDAHGHMSGLGAMGLGVLDLRTTRTIDEVIAQVREAIQKAKPGEWIIGRGWDHERWPDKAMPTHEPLSAISPANPVWIERVDGHAGLANSVALRSAQISASTVAPVGGEIGRDATGQPTGILVDNAMELVTRVMPGLSAKTKALLLKAQAMCLAVGLTGVHDAGITPAEAQTYQELAANGQLKLRIYGMIAAANADEYYRDHGPMTGERFTLRACKIVADGAMGSRGAWMLEPYADRPVDASGQPYVGLPVTPPEQIRRVAKLSVEAGFQVCTHAIGDRANHEVLGVYEAVIGPRSSAVDLRWRVEHAQLLRPDDLSLFAKLDVIASIQPTHATSDMRWAEARVGAHRLAGAYAWRSMLKSGAALAFGSDFPVESHNPFLGIYAAVTRQDLEGNPPGGWRAQECLTREEAVRAFTLGAAYAAFEEHDKGSLSPGKLADFIVLDRDVMTCDVREIPQTRVLRTVIGGETVYEE